MVQTAEHVKSRLRLFVRDFETLTNMVKVPNGQHGFGWKWIGVACGLPPAAKWSVMIALIRRNLLFLGLGVASALVTSGQTLAKLAADAGLTELAGTFSTEKSDRILGDHGSQIDDLSDRAAAAMLVSMGVWTPGQLSDLAGCRQIMESWAAKADERTAVVELDLSNVAEILGVSAFGGHEQLRRDTALMATLDEAIGEEVLTGYGLRTRGVSAETDDERTLIYSHSSLPHVKQLIGLVASEGLRGQVMIAPKIAAFVFRDGWGERPEWINELGPGIYVAQGPEMLVHFEFESSSDRQRFDALIDLYAKKDEESETGNLTRSWWQPFYYTKTKATGFKRISRVTLSGENIEASLLMLPPREPVVREHFADSGWDLAIDSIWVNAAFHRFLEGGYR